MSQENADKLHASIVIAGDGGGGLATGVVQHMSGVVASSVAYGPGVIPPSPRAVNFQLVDPLPEGEQIIGVNAFMDDGTPLMCAVETVDATNRSVLVSRPEAFINGGVEPNAPWHCHVTIYRRHSPTS